MSEAEFQSLQKAFAAHLRDPEAVAPPEGLEERRLKIYRELLFNNINGFLSNGFPVLHSLLDEQRWHRLVRAFFANHASASPYFVDIPGEFVRWLVESFEPEAQDPPFMLALAHYEWIELVLDIETSELPTAAVPGSVDVLRSVPRLSPLVRVLSYEWPVHQICADFMPDAPLASPVWLLVYRGRDDQVGFMEINQATARLLALIELDSSVSGEGHLQALAEELGMPPEAVLGFGREILERMQERAVILFPDDACNTP